MMDTFLNDDRRLTPNHRLVKYMYMSMRKWDARLQAVSNPYYSYTLYTTTQDDSIFGS